MKINPWSFVCVCNFSFSRCNAGAKEQVHSSFSEGDQASVQLTKRKESSGVVCTLEANSFIGTAARSNRAASDEEIRRLERGHTIEGRALMPGCARRPPKQINNPALSCPRSCQPKHAGRQAPLYISCRTFQISLGRLRVMRRTTTSN